MYSVAYDSDNGKVIRFGGELVNPPEPVGGTSCFDLVAKTWVDLQATGDIPTLRRLQSMVYDPYTHKVIMFGGMDEANPYYAGLDETWAYDPAANTWARVQPSGEQPPSRSAVLYGPRSGERQGDSLRRARQRVSRRHMGLRSRGQHVDRAQSQRQPAVGSRWSSMVYDPHSHRMILFGGEDASGYRNDTWAYDPAKNTWTDLSGEGASD